MFRHRSEVWQVWERSAPYGDIRASRPRTYQAGRAFGALLGIEESWTAGRSGQLRALLRKSKLAPRPARVEARVGSSPIGHVANGLWSTKLGADSIDAYRPVHVKHRITTALRLPPSPTSKSSAENRLVPEERVLDAGPVDDSSTSVLHMLTVLERNHR